MCIYARTAARIWRNADKEHGENTPKMPRPRNRRVLMHCFASYLRPQACVLLLLCRKSMIVRVHYERVHIAILLQICALARLIDEFGVNKV